VIEGTTLDIYKFKLSRDWVSVVEITPVIRRHWRQVRGALKSSFAKPSPFQLSLIIALGAKETNISRS